MIPTAETTPPMMLKERDMPRTMARGLSLCPTEPAMTTGKRGRTQGDVTDSTPPANAIKRDGASTMM
jgi:hypothetical protein